MHIVLTVGVAAILTVIAILWVVFALIRAHFRRQRRIREELKEMKRQQKIANRKTINVSARRIVDAIPFTKRR